LRGSGHTLARHRPIIAIEVWDTNLLFVHPRKGQGLAPGHAVAEDPKREIGNSGRKPLVYNA
jgi:hypothetical protein